MFRFLYVQFYHFESSASASIYVSGMLFSKYQVQPIYYAIIQLQFNFIVKWVIGTQYLCLSYGQVDLKILTHIGTSSLQFIFLCIVLHLQKFLLQHASSKSFKCKIPIPSKYLTHIDIPSTQYIPMGSFPNHIVHRQLRGRRGRVR